VLLGALSAGVDAGWRWWRDGRFVVSTDDAYVRGDVATIATRLPGHVVAIEVRNGDRVNAGDVIAQLDDGDIVLAIAAARARIATLAAVPSRMSLVEWPFLARSFMASAIWVAPKSQSCPS
jgi:membrane fusion protein (multidrug efflux system)